MEEICTVLLISYNHVKYIERAIDSVLDQDTEYGFKIEIFDDGSKDGTQEIIQRYHEKYPQLISVHFNEKNMGAQFNYWKAFISVKTKYFTVLECDDYYCDPRKVQLQIKALENHPECSFCGHDTYIFSEDNTNKEFSKGARACVEPILKKKMIFRLKDFDQIESGGYIPYVSARMIRTECLNLDCIEYKESVLFDNMQFYYLLLQGKYYYIDIPMSVYWRNNASTCSGKKPLDFLNVYYANAIEFNKQTNNRIADKIFRDCIFQTKARIGFCETIPVIQEVVDKNEIDGKCIKPNEIWTRMSKLDKDTYYFLCCAGIGPLIYSVSLKNELLKKYEGPICFLVPENQVFIMDMLGEKDYLAVDYSKVNLIAMSLQCPNPEKGKIYVTDSFCHPEREMFVKPIRDFAVSVHFYDWYRESLGLGEKGKHELLSFSIPPMDKELERKIKGVIDVTNTVLFFPESYLQAEVDFEFWRNKARELKHHGYNIVSCVHYIENTIPETMYIELSLKQAIVLASLCKEVYAERNGICDLLVPLHNRLTVYYRYVNSFYIFGLNRLYENANITEIIVEQNEGVVNSIINTHIRGQLRAKLFGIITVPDVIYRFYRRHRKKISYFNKFVKWS